MATSRRVCGNCGSLQGPYDRLFVGFRKTGHWVFTCKVPMKHPDGTRTTDKQRLAAINACAERRAKRNGPAQTHHSA